jgi:hypothetical protein
MSNQLPANFASFLTLLAGQQVDLGVPNPSLDGRSAFTISGWFQVPDSDAEVTVLAQGQQLRFSFAARKPTVSMGGATLQLSEQVPAGRFCQFAAVYQPIDGSSGTLQFFAWGALVGEATVAPTSGQGTAALCVGDLSHAVTMRRLWLTNEALPADQVVDTRYAPTGAAPFAVQSTWDYGQLPAAIIGAATPITNGAVQSVTTPGLYVGASGSATLSVADPESTSEGSLQGWFYFPPTIPGASVDVTQTLVHVAGPEGYIELTATPLGNGTWALGAGNFGNLAFGKTGVALSGWHNIAVTWSSSDAHGIIYLDGQLLVQDMQAVLTLTPTTVTLGNTAAGQSGAAFVGLVQVVTVWDVALAGSDIAAQQLPFFPMTDTDPIAACDFTVDPPIDLVSGVALALQSGAVVQHVLVAAGDVRPNPQLLVTRPKRPSLAQLRPLSPLSVSPTSYSSAREQQLLAEIDALLAKAPDDAHLQAEGAKLRDGIRQRFADGRAGKPDLTGIVYTELQGDDWITFYYRPTGPEAIYSRRKSSSHNDECVNWVISFVATALFGLLDIMGIPLSTGTATKAIQKLLGKSVIWEAIGEVLESTITADSIIAIVEAIYDGGGLTTFIKAVLDDVSWWDFLWMVTDVGIELIGLLVPGVEEALIVLKCAKVVTQLFVLLDHRPSGCPG